jgi:hypothetical protein
MRPAILMGQATAMINRNYFGLYHNSCYSFLKFSFLTNFASIFISYRFTMKRCLLLALLAAVSIPSFSQADTTIKYYGKNGKETTKDSANSFVKFFKQAGLWQGMEYYTKGGSLKSDGKYNEMNLETAVGSVNNYKEDGKLDFSGEYVDGKLSERTYYYKNGDRKSWVSYTDKGVLQKGWDETGKEVKNYIVEQEARFKGGAEGWRKYLEKNLNASIATDIGAPVGNYEVKLQFVVNKEGIIATPKAVSIPAKCKACATEALRVLRESPVWEPAIQNNEPVIYQAIQIITFQVADDKKKGKD